MISSIPMTFKKPKLSLYYLQRYTHIQGLQLTLASWPHPLPLLPSLGFSLLVFFLFLTSYTKYFCLWDFVHLPPWSKVPVSCKSPFKGHLLKEAFYTIQIKEHSLYRSFIFISPVLIVHKLLICICLIYFCFSLSVFPFKNDISIRAGTLPTLFTAV